MNNTQIRTAIRPLVNSASQYEVTVVNSSGLTLATGLIVKSTKGDFEVDNKPFLFEQIKKATIGNRIVLDFGFDDQQ